MTIKKAETFRDWTIHLDTEEVDELMYALDRAIHMDEGQDDFISKLHAESCKCILNVLNSKG